MASRAAIVGCLVLCVVVTLAATPYKEFDPYPFTANSTTCGSSSNHATVLSALRDHLSFSSISGRLVTNRTALFAYAEDYGHIIHTLPIAAFIPHSAEEVRLFIIIAELFSLDPSTRFQIVVRGGSGNVQGATQASCSGREILLDTTYLNSVQISDGYAWVGPGANWLSLVQAAAAQGLRPPVIPDYLAITLGGFISVGGFGGDTPHVGPAVDQVLALRLVTPLGNEITAMPGNRYFEAMRGGMGSFGVITGIKIKLVPTKAVTQSIHILTPYYASFLATMKNIMANYLPSRVQTIQAFAVPNSEASFEIFVAPKPDLDAVRTSVDQVLAVNKTWVYYIELAVRGDGYSNFPTKSEIAGWLAAPMDPALVFFANYSTPDWDNRLELFTVPALVATGAWYAPKPWTVVAFPDSSASEFDTFLQPLDPILDIGMGLVAIYPCNTSLFQTNSFLSVPRTSPVFYLATLGRNELTGTAQGIARQERGNRAFWDAMRTRGAASIYASSYITDFGPADWQHSYGNKWQDFLHTKKQLDPLFLFGDQRNFGFATLYH
eukprot:Phypoly_transcript_04515.p1 GENE.Phypoly_transcript_04515~~Phypoly_transcript_04515.p1  ORF type:complete len:550 (+),score=88.89 Phypoly_transcript_04515:275-1924(+)